MRKDFAIIMVCNNYWGRYSHCHASWMKSMEVAGEIVPMYVGTIGNDVPGAMLGWHGEFVNTSVTAYPRGSTLESKGRMLLSLMAKCREARKILFTDADIIAPPMSVCAMIETTAPYAVADRCDLSMDATCSILGGEDPWGVNRPDINRSKRGMGWFQMVDADLLKTVMGKVPWDHPGYDLVDWVLNKELMAATGEPAVVDAGLPFLHMHHGNPGANWKGTTTKW